VIGFNFAIFGGVIPTPAMDRIAKAGLRYTQFHSTALCSPTRAALITGRNHRSVGAGHAVPGVIGHDEEHVGRALGRNDGWRPPRLGVARAVFDHSAKFRVGRRELFAVDGCRGARGTWRAGYLLCRTKVSS
jgi:hypothetical protein